MACWVHSLPNVSFDHIIRIVFWIFTHKHFEYTFRSMTSPVLAGRSCILWYFLLRMQFCRLHILSVLTIVFVYWNRMVRLLQCSIVTNIWAIWTIQVPNYVISPLRILVVLLFFPYLVWFLLFSSFTLGIPWARHQRPAYLVTAAVAGWQ